MAEVLGRHDVLAREQRERYQGHSLRGMPGQWHLFAAFT